MFNICVGTFLACYLGFGLLYPHHDALHLGEHPAPPRSRCCLSAGARSRPRLPPMALLPQLLLPGAAGDCAWVGEPRRVLP